MSKTLNLVAILLRQARHYQELGLGAQAKQLFEKLRQFRSLPAEVAHDVQLGLAECCRDADDHAQERQHLRNAMIQNPENADTLARMARAHMDDAGAARDAEPYLNKAHRLEPRNVAHLLALVEVLRQKGDNEAAQRNVKKAYRLESSNLAVLKVYVDLLIEMGETEEAQSLLKSAMFTHSSDRRYRELYREFQFRIVAADQARRTSIRFPEEPTILPFHRAAPTTKRFTIDGQIFRIDGPDRPAPRRDAVRKKNTRRG